MEFLQTTYGLVLSLATTTVLLFALPLATRRWGSTWLLVAIAGIGLAVNAYLTFTDYWVDMHGFLRMSAIVLAWPYFIGLVVTAIAALLDRFRSAVPRSLFWVVALLGLLVAIAPCALLVVG